MKKLTLTLLTIVAFALSGKAQTEDIRFANELLDSAEIYYRQEQYFEAYERYKAAKVYGKESPSIVEEGEAGMEKAIIGIKAQKARSDSLLQVAQAALARAEEMQLKVETAMFDKAVKEHFDQWKGYANYDWTRSSYEDTKKGLEILNQIDSLDLSNNALLRVPQEIAECPNLRHINLLGNKDMDWQDYFTKVKAIGINSVYVSVNDLSDIKSDYWHLITGIEILKNEITEIPNNILQQKQLTYLEFNSDLTTLPPEIGNLTNLTELNLRDNQLSSLPPEIGNLTNLTELVLEENQLSSLPPEIGNLTNLTKLALGYNDLSSLPPEIGNLTNLTWLDLYENELSSLPPEIGNLTNLNRLYLRDNQLSSLPLEIGNLTNLTFLNLEKNQLSSLPPEIGNLTNLNRLSLYNNELSSLPLEIGNLTNLTVLYLWNNQLSSLPPEIGNLTNLTELSLGDNQLTYLPTEIGNLTNLTGLGLGRNQFSSLPPEIGNLTNLTKLSLSSNQLSSLPPEIGNLTNLTGLYLWNNQLSSLPPEIGNLTNLTELDLSNNDSLDIASVCNAFANFSKDLIISTNRWDSNDDNSKLLIIIPKQSSLPPEIGNLKNLKKLYLGHKYFSAAEKQKIDSWFEGTGCKILWW